MSDLLELAERLTTLTEPDRELDKAIWLACTEGATRQTWSYTHKASGRECEVDETRDASGVLIIVPAYTASLDAALTLVPDEFGRPRPFHIQRSRSSGCCAVVWTNSEFNRQVNAEGKTPTLALGAAALRARQVLA